MSDISSYHSIAQHAPGSYICSLERTPFSSLAEKEQSKRIIASVQRLDFSPQKGEAWFPIIRSHPEHEVFGVVLCINTHKKGILLSPENQELLRSWLSVLLDDIPVEIPPVYISNLPTNWNIKGSSWGLAGLIAIISALIQQKPRQIVICSGVLSPLQAIIDPVSSPLEKQTLCSWEAPQTNPIIISSKRHIGEIFHNLFSQDWRQLLIKRLHMTPRSLAEEALNQYRQRNSVSAYRMANNVILMNPTSDIPKILAYFVLGSIDKHNGNSIASIEKLTQARSLILNCSETDQLDFYLRFRLEANLGIAMMQNLQITPAISIMEHALRELTTIQAFHRDLNWHSVSLRIAGTLRWLYVANGSLSKAKEIQLMWPLSKARIPQHLCRSLYSLVDIYWRTGENEQALETYAQAKEMFAEVRPVEREVTQRYLILAGIRIGVESPRLQPLHWPHHLIDQLELLEYALQSNQLPTLFTAHLNPLPTDITTLFILSGFVARHISLHGSHPTFSPFLTELTVYRGKMPLLMQEALIKLQHGQGEDWALIAPY